jgi:hypothetical protein
MGLYGVPLAYPSSGSQCCMRRWLGEQRLECMECRLLIRAAAVSIICVAGSVSSDSIVWSAACSSEQRLSVLYASLAL